MMNTRVVVREKMCRQGKGMNNEHAKESISLLVQDRNRDGQAKKEDILNKTERSVKNNSRSTKKGTQARDFKHFLKNCTAA